MIAAVRATSAATACLAEGSHSASSPPPSGGVLAPALVATLGRANWWLPGRHQDAAVAAYEALRREPAVGQFGTR